MTLSLFLQHVLNGISLGSLYALIAIGYTIIYGVLGLINLAHGDIFMVGAFLAMWGVTRYHVPLLASLCLAAAAAVLVALLIERVAYRPLRDFKMSAFISTFAVSFFLQNFMIVFFTPRPQPFPVPAFTNTTFQLGEVRLPAVTLLIIGVSGILFLALSYLVNRTKMGTAMRALSKDMETTKLMGVDINKVISFAFAISTLYAACGAFMWAFKFPSVNPYSGALPGLKGFIGAVIGGIGSIPGALLGGFILGVAEIMLVALMPRLSAWRDVFAYIALILLLLFRPGGLFNVKLTEEKV